MPENRRVPSASERIEDAARWVDVVLMKLDREADAFHAEQERTRQILAGYLLRLQVLGVSSGEPSKADEEATRFDAAYRGVVHAAEEACRAIASRESRPRTTANLRAPPNLDDVLPFSAPQ